MNQKTKVIGVRIDERTDARLRRLESVVKVDAVPLLRAALDAVLDYFEEHGELRLPILVVSAKPNVQSSTSSQPAPVKGSKAKVK